MTELEHQKALLLVRIESQRQQVGTRIGQLTRATAPATAAASLGRFAGSRLGVLGPVAGLFAKGPRLSTWIRILTIAHLVFPLVAPLLSGGRRTRGRARTPAAQ